ncbi:MerR family transcriptional regulator [Rickettsiales endosymbiont of Stachyamoeba lipophora]|uniref:MerR family transcriptional regulator n=1 Tax=Rickettsiales endosymbiont of Stachyamoeba lipophora TaxID=2486578 RepID=UPI000F646184|nr:MerR family transcriptional regulator [Rickettsiales endosymbiont of Stachyamoeba lipophora]AZL15676.1 MerR family transcriptional regulator [Rickettsiales endosymbiont of Stachyamoeba lipophora]
MTEPKVIDSYKTIGEAAQLLGLPTHVLRFWETKFKAINPKKIKARRYYNNKQIETLITIKDLLYNKGFTIQGAIQFLKENKESESINNATFLWEDTTQLIDLNVQQLVKIKTSLQTIRNKLLSV